jgi:hypothetical protein
VRVATASESFLKRTAVLAIMLLTVGLSAWRMVSRDSQAAETPAERAHRLCTECDLSGDEIDRLIDDFTNTPLTREEAVRLFEDTYSDPAKLEAARELCMDCVEAIFDAGD